MGSHIRFDPTLPKPEFILNRKTIAASVAVTVIAITACQLSDLSLPATGLTAIAVAIASIAACHFFPWEELFKEHPGKMKIESLKKFSQFPNSNDFYWPDKVSEEDFEAAFKGTANRWHNHFYPPEPVHVSETAPKIIHTWQDGDHQVELLQSKKSLSYKFKGKVMGLDYPSTLTIDDAVAHFKIAEAIVEKDGSVFFTKPLNHLDEHWTKDKRCLMFLQTQRIWDASKLVMRVTNLHDKKNETTALHLLPAADSSPETRAYLDLLLRTAKTKADFDQFIQTFELNSLAFFSHATNCLVGDDRDLQRSRDLLASLEHKKNRSILPFVPFLKPVTMPSLVDDRIVISRFQWAVTLVSTQNPDIDRHAMLLIEGINIDSPFYNIAHFVQGNGGRVKIHFLNKNEIAFDYKGSTWKRSALKMDKMRETIILQSDNAIPVPRFNRLGGRTVAPLSGHNCLTWALEMLQIIDVELPRAPLDWAIALPSSYTPYPRSHRPVAPPADAALY